MFARNVALEDLDLNNFRGVVMPRSVLVKYRMMPESPDVDVNKIKENVYSLDLDIKDLKIVPIAFGLKAIEVVVSLPDKEGVAEESEKKLSEIEGVGDVETVSITLV